MKHLLTSICLVLALENAAQEKPKTAQWLGILTLTDKYKDEKNWTSQDVAITGEHFQRLVKMKNEGIVLLGGRTQLQTNDPGMMGLVIFY